MFFWTRILIIVVFLLWLIPMGIFITPSKEKMACGGQRAICMCSHAASMSSNSQKTTHRVYKAVPTPQKESSSSGSYFLSAIFRNDNPLVIKLSFFIHENFYNLAVYRSIDHVPKI